MNIWAFLTGLMIGIFPLLFILKIFRGPLLFIVNPYIKGAVLGFFLWGVINTLIYFEAKYNVLGLLSTEDGFGTIVIFTSSLQGFITAGLAAAFLSSRLGRKKKQQTPE